MRVLRASLATAAIAVTLASPSVAQVEEIIDFESFDVGSNTSYGTLVIGDYRLSGVHWHTINDFAPSGGTCFNGSKVFAGQDGGALANDVTLFRADGQPFSLRSLDVAELWVGLPGFPNADRLRLTVVLPSGEESVIELQLDGVNDGPQGSVDDFQTFDLQGQLPVVTSVTFEGISVTGAVDGAWAIDDLDVTPGCSLTYGSGCAGEGGFVPTLSNPVCDSQTLQVQFAIENAPGGSVAVLLFGTSKLAAQIGATDCHLLVGNPFPISFTLPLGGVGPGAGFTFVNGVFPPSATGLQFTMQAAIGDGSSSIGFTMTNGLEVTAP